MSERINKLKVSNKKEDYMYNIYVDVKVNTVYLKNFFKSEKIDLERGKYKLTGYIRAFAEGVVEISNIGISRNKNLIYGGEKSIYLPYEIFEIQENNLYLNLINLIKLYDNLKKMLKLTEKMEGYYMKFPWYKIHLIFLRRKKRRYLHRKKQLEVLFEKLSEGNWGMVISEK